VNSIAPAPKFEVDEHFISLAIETDLPSPIPTAPDPLECSPSETRRETI